MFALPLAFSNAAVLAALALLPALWVLLRLTPPRPRRIAFPPLRLILDVRHRQETPARTPWWLLVLRLAIAAALILAMAGPIWDASPIVAGGKGPLLILLDDGWPAAPDWAARMTFVHRRVERAEQQGRLIAVEPLSRGPRDIVPIDAAHEGEQLRALRPRPWTPDRIQALAPIRAFLSAHPGASVLWLADGLARGRARAFGLALEKAAGSSAVRVILGNQGVIALAGTNNGAGGLDVRVLRAGGKGATSGVLRAFDRKGVSVGRATFDFHRGAVARARFDLPVALRNDVARIEVQGERSAGAVALLDARSQRRRVGVFSGESADVSEPLLAPDYYINKALAPYADVRDPRPGQADPIGALIGDQIAVLVLADVGALAGPTHEEVAKWVEAGGVLVRFAGTRLARSADDLVPVRLRSGGRVLGGALSWAKPKRLAPFPRSSPFFGLTPPQDVKVKRQVLAEPDASLPGKTWAALADGTPLVTAQRRGKGLLVLFHVTADSSWSNLPLSGLFVNMLRRLVDLSVQPGASSTSSPAATVRHRAATAAPTSTLDGFGALGPPSVTAKPVRVDFKGIAGKDHPPGFYGPTQASIAVNALSAADRLRKADYSAIGLRTFRLKASAPIDLRAPLLTLAFLLLLADAIASLWLAGGLQRRARSAVALVLLSFVAATFCLAPRPAAAQSAPLAPQPSPRDLSAALKTHLAYVKTGDASVDQESLAGLASLSRALSARTALSPGRPFGVDPAHDELVFYPMLYWPIVADRPQPSHEAVENIANYMKEGGTIVFDTRDALTSRPGGPPTPERVWLRKLLAGVDVPRLEPVPRDHVVTKTFYLLDRFVGRTTTGRTWIQALPPRRVGDRAARPVRAGDGVSPIIITSNDLAAAWATTRSGAPLYPLVPGGARQHEMAIRGGVNLVMYTLTGNYKADQVHVRDLLQRLAH